MNENSVLLIAREFLRAVLFSHFPRLQFSYKSTLAKFTKYLETQHKLSDRQVQWLELLNQYLLRFAVFRGKHNTVPYAFSRQRFTPPRTNKSNHLLLQRLIQKIKTLFSRKLSIIDLPQTTLDELRKKYLADPEFSDVFQIHEKPFEIKKWAALQIRQVVPAQRKNLE